MHRAFTLYAYIQIIYKGLWTNIYRGGDLEGDWGTVPPKFEVGRRPMHWSTPNI